MYTCVCMCVGKQGAGGRRAGREGSEWEGDGGCWGREGGGRREGWGWGVRMGGGWRVLGEGGRGQKGGVRVGIHYATRHLFIDCYIMKLKR